jgi:hypothetical protein
MPVKSFVIFSPVVLVIINLFMVAIKGSNTHTSFKSLKDTFQLGLISCQFLPPGGSMGPRYVSLLFYSEKSQNTNNLWAVKLGKE